jgi:hypothetical protein
MKWIIALLAIFVLYLPSPIPALPQERSPELIAFRKQIAERVSEEAAKAISAAVAFEVYDIRPLVDTGQKWEEYI